MSKKVLIRWSKLLNPKTDKKGFTILEIIIVVGLMSAVTLGTMQFMLEIVKSSNTLTARHDVQTLVNIMNNQILSSSTCRLAIAPTQNFDQSRASASSQNEGHGMPVQWVFSTNETISNGSALSTYDVDIERLEFFDSEFIGNVGSNRQYQTTLVAVFQYRKKVAGANVFPRRLGPLYIETNPSGRIVDCYSTTGPDSASVDRICQAMGLPLNQDSQTCDLTSLQEKTMVQVCAELGLNVHPNGKSCDRRHQGKNK